MFREKQAELWAWTEGSIRVDLSHPREQSGSCLQMSFPGEEMPAPEGGGKATQGRALWSPQKAGEK